jgi:hypothetical protein
MTVLDRGGQIISIGDTIRFRYAGEPDREHQVTAITTPTDGHATLVYKLNDGTTITIDSLSVDKVDPPPHPETSTYIDLTQGPIRPVTPIPVPTPDPWDTPTENQFERGPEPDVQHPQRAPGASSGPRKRAERDHPAPSTPKARIPPPGPERLIDKDGLPHSKPVTKRAPAPSHKKSVKPTTKGTTS